jgi:hypothetical protein
MRTKYEFLFNPEPPWIYIGEGEPERLEKFPSYFYTRPGIDVCVRRIRGRKASSTQGLMDEMAAALQFFDSFGENWWALRDCLESLDEWLPAQGYVVVIEEAEMLLVNEPSEQMEALLKTFDDVGRWWAEPIYNNPPYDRGPIPFHAIMNISSGASNNGKRIAEIARNAQIAIRS